MRVLEHSIGLIGLRDSETLRGEGGETMKQQASPAQVHTCFHLPYTSRHIFEGVGVARGWEYRV